MLLAFTPALGVPCPKPCGWGLVKSTYLGCWFKARSPPASTGPFVSLGSKGGFEPHMRHQNKGIFNQNANLEFCLAFGCHRFGGGKTKKSSRHDPKIPETVSLARLMNLSTTCTVRPLTRPTRTHTRPRLFAGAGHRQGSPAKHAHTHTQTSNFLKPAAPDSAICAGNLSPPRWTPGTGLHRALYADDGLIECIKRWTRGSRDRIIVTLVNLAKHFGVVKEVAIELVDTLGQGVDTGHGKGP